MVHLELTADEADTLRTILQSYLEDLRMEIADTDSYDMRSDLKQVEVFIKDLLYHRLPQPAAA